MKNTDMKKSLINEVHPLRANCEHPLIKGLLEAIVKNEAEQYILDHGIEICQENLGQCIIEHHAIDKIKFKEYYEAHQDNNSGIKEYPKQWSEIESLLSSVSCYDQYLGFNFIGTRMELKLLNFTTIETCYSKIFLTGIKDWLQMGPTEEFIFTQGKVPDPQDNNKLKDKVIFKVIKGGTIYFYDISDFPGILPKYFINPV